MVPSALLKWCPASKPFPWQYDDTGKDVPPQCQTNLETCFQSNQTKPNQTKPNQTTPSPPCKNPTPTPMIYIYFDETKSGLSSLGSTPRQQLTAIEEWLAKPHDIELHLGAQHEAAMLRILRRVREGKVDPALIEFSCQGKLVAITPDGDFAERVPTGFFNWRSEELF